MRGRYPGSRVVASIFLPKAKASVDPLTVARRLQLRGQPRCHTAFRFKSLSGTLHVRGIILNTEQPAQSAGTQRTRFASTVGTGK